VAEQGTHKPLVVSSNLTLGTLTRQTRRVLLSVVLAKLPSREFLSGGAQQLSPLTLPLTLASAKNLPAWTGFMINRYNRCMSPIDQLIRTRRRTIALIVQPDGRLVVRAPLRMPEGQILEFVESHTEWVRRRQAEARLTAPPPPKEYVTGEIFPYLGRTYPLTIVERQRPGLRFTDGFYLARAARNRAEQAFVRWYKARALEVISERVALYAGRFGLVPQGIRITSARTRWGSCSPEGRLNFTWRLILAPLPVVDYVVIHELAHLKIKSHSRRFWKKVESMLPGYRSHVVWLSKYGHQLSL